MRFVTSKYFWTKNTISLSGLYHNETLDPVHKETKYYNRKGNLINIQNEYWKSDSSIWMNSKKSIIKNNQKGNPKIVVHYDWDSFNNNWKIIGRNLYTYTSFNKLKTGTFERWDNSIWTATRKTDLIYDKNHFLIRTTREEWDRRSGDWGLTNESTIVNDSLGNPIEIISNEYEYKSGKIRFSTIIKNEFDSLNKQISSEKAQKVETFEKVSKSTFNYDKNRHLINHIYSIWDTTSGDWMIN